MKWYCYICGKLIDSKSLFLVSMNESTDRVFVLCSQACVDRCDDVLSLHVGLIEEKNDLH